MNNHFIIFNFFEKDKMKIKIAKKYFFVVIFANVFFGQFDHFLVKFIFF